MGGSQPAVLGLAAQYSVTLTPSEHARHEALIAMQHAGGRSSSTTAATCAERESTARQPNEGPS